MKTGKRMWAWVLSLAVALSLVACTKPLTQPEQMAQTQIQLTDQAGRTVILSRPARRVVSCYYVTTYAMLALRQGEKLVGIEKKADTRPIYQMAQPSLLDLPSVGSLKEIDVEGIAALSPDLVILPKKLQDSATALEAIGIVTLIVDPETADGLQEMLHLIGTACGTPENARQLTEYLQAKIQDFETPEETPSVLFFGNSTYLTAAPAGMYQSDLITLAGGVNALAGQDGSYWQEISYETVLSADPDYLVIPAGAAYTAEDILADSALCQLRAVREKRIVTVPGCFEEWDSPIPSGVLGMLWLRSVLHPSDYSADAFRKDVVDFYETFYGFTPTDQTLAALA